MNKEKEPEKAKRRQQEQKRKEETKERKGNENVRKSRKRESVPQLVAILLATRSFSIAAKPLLERMRQGRKRAEKDYLCDLQAKS